MSNRSAAGRWIVAGLTALLVGCQPAAEWPDAAPEAPGSGGGAAAAADAPLWSRDGVTGQLRVAWLRQRTSAGMGFNPGTTRWRPTREELTGFRAPATDAGTAGDLLLVLARRLGGDALGSEVWEQTIRLWTESPDAAVGAILSWGMKDDSVVGQDFRVHLRRDEDGWYVERVEERFHCGRGVSAEGLCL